MGVIGKLIIKLKLFVIVGGQVMESGMISYCVYQEIVGLSLLGQMEFIGKGGDFLNFFSRYLDIRVDC